MRAAGRNSAAAATVAALGALVLTGLIGGAITAPAGADDTPSGSLVIRAVTAPGAAPVSFSFAISCTGDRAPIERTVVVPTVNGVGSATVAGIPVDMACLVVDHPAAGWRVETSNPQAVVASAEGMPVEFDHSAPAPAALTLVKTSDPDGAYSPAAAPPPVTRGSLITYVITYRNSGDVPAAATISDAIPAGTSYAGGVVCRPACTRAPTVAGRRVSFGVPAGAGATGMVSYAVRVAEDAADGDVIGSRATIEPGHRRSDVVLHRVSVPRGGLRLTVAVDRASAPAGAVVEYSIDVRNRGTARQHAVTVTDTVPANAGYVAGSAGCLAPCHASYDARSRTVTWRVGLLAADQSARGLTFRARISPLIAGADGSLPGTVVLDSAAATSSLTRATASNQVMTVVVGVLS